NGIGTGDRDRDRNRGWGWRWGSSPMTAWRWLPEEGHEVAGDAELLVGGGAGEAGQLAQRHVHVLRRDALAVRVERERLRVDRQRLEAAVRRADHLVARDARAGEEHAGDVPVILAIALVVEGRPAEVGADDDVHLARHPHRVDLLEEEVERADEDHELL